MASGKRVRTTRRKTAQIIQLPRDDFSFEACDIQCWAMKERYERDSALVGIVQGILCSDSKTLKGKVHHLPRASNGHSIHDLTHDLIACGEGFKYLAELFACAAARLTVIDAKLV
jgi:hypothetical protein